MSQDKGTQVFGMIAGGMFVLAYGFLAVLIVVAVLTYLLPILGLAGAFFLLSRWK